MDENSKKALIVAYYISKYDDVALSNLGFKSWSECFQRVNSVLGTNINSIRNMRDEFDSIHDNTRVGFKRELSISRREIDNEYGTLDEQELRNIVHSILSESNDNYDSTLRSLSMLANESKRSYLDNFQEGDLSLTDDFKREFAAFLRNKGDNVVFFSTTSIITTAGNKKIYAPNQWYIIAEYMVDYVIELFKYKEQLESIFDYVKMDTEERKDYIRHLKTNATDEDKSAFAEKCLAFYSESGIDEINENIIHLTKFVTDYNWWYGSKTIDRGDFYVSPVLGLLNVVNASQSYIADICYYYSLNDGLFIASKKQVETTHVFTSNISNTESSVSESTSEYRHNSNVPRLTNGINLIVYGAPGTGKSKYLEDNFGQENRVVFHQEYTYYDFVGSYKPVPLYKKGIELKTSSGEPFTKGEPFIDYQYVPGPFLNVFINAWLNPGKMHTLIIEEINRANAASVFGEIFQLLDRNPDGSGEYVITPSKELHNYLSDFEHMQPYIEHGLSMPSNMNIVATMNSADQGVTQLDAAFKRRWEFMYLKIAVSGAVHEEFPLQYSGVSVFWGDFVNAINNKLKELRVEEDRMVGPYFIRPDEVGKSAATYKILLYLWDDVLRHRRKDFFSNDIRAFSDLVEKFTKNDVLQLSEFIDLENSVKEDEELESDEQEENSDFDLESENID